MHKLSRNSTAFPTRRLVALVCLLLSMISFISTTGISSMAVAFAEDNASVLSDNLKAYGGDQSDDGFTKTITKAQTDYTARNNFGYVLKRVFQVGHYLNATPDAVVPSGFTKKSYNCNVNDPNAGTPLYHNCDVPNLMTEFVQDMTAIVIPTGPKNAQVRSAKAFNGLGIPSTLPGDGTVPVNASDRSVKYTALELFGYNLNYTIYLGEWDDIKTMTTARLLTNFGIMDSLKLTAVTVTNGIAAGVSAGTSAAYNDLKNGNILRASGDFFTKGWAAGTTESINTILDTSDENVFNTYGWYRVGYGDTLYGARELSQSEQSDYIAQQFIEKLRGVGVKVQTPAEVANLSQGPPQPTTTASKCTATDSSGKQVTIPDTQAGGISKADCISQVQADGYTKPVWTAGTTQTLQEWKNANQSAFDIASKYGLNCTIDVSDEKDRATTVPAFYDCWQSKWPTIEKRAEATSTKDNTNTFISTLLSLSGMLNFYGVVPHRNFNAPASRFVCTDSEGKDLVTKDSTTLTSNYVFLYNDNGTLNSRCSSVRAPIQNGYYGNGYSDDLPEGSTSNAVTVPTDTRYSALRGYTLASAIFNPVGVYDDGSGLASGALKVTDFITQMTNALVDLTFSPIMDKLGVHNLIVKLVAAFRESIFFPFAALFIAFTALYIFITTARKRAYRKGFKDLLLTVLIFFTGTMLMFQTDAVMKFADSFPAQVETDIVGAILSVDQNSQDLCSASQTGSNTEAFSARAADRTMECKIWEVFAFDPWVYGQWGTSYNNLYANGTSTSGNTMQNTNGNLVGDAGVDMGGNVTVHNWALYQLYATTSGTSTTEDNGVYASNGQISRNFYRLVDLQAGPNNGAGTDSRYFNTWNGKQMGNRTMTAIMSIGVAGFGLFCIVDLAIMKVFVTLALELMFLFIPFMFLIGLQHTFGRRKLKQYGLTMLGLLVQRVVLLALIAAMLLFLSLIASTVSNYVYAALLMLGILIAFRHNKKAILKKAGLSSGGRGFMGINSPQQTMKKIMPKSMKNSLQRVNAGAMGAVTGFGGAVLSGDFTHVREAVHSAQNNKRERLLNDQLTKGELGFITKDKMAARSGQNSAYVQSLRKRNESITRGDNTEYAEYKAKVKSDVNADFSHNYMKGTEKGDTSRGDTSRKVDLTDSRNNDIMEELIGIERQLGRIDSGHAIVSRQINRRQEKKLASGNEKEVSREMDWNQKQHTALASRQSTLEDRKKALRAELFLRSDPNANYDKSRRELAEQGVYIPAISESEKVRMELDRARNSFDETLVHSKKMVFAHAKHIRTRVISTLADMKDKDERLMREHEIAAYDIRNEIEQADTGSDDK